MDDDPGVRRFIAAPISRFIGAISRRLERIAEPKRLTRAAMNRRPPHEGRGRNARRTEEGALGSSQGRRVHFVGVSLQILAYGDKRPAGEAPGP